MSKLSRFFAAMHCRCCQCGERTNKAKCPKCEHVICKKCEAA